METQTQVPPLKLSWREKYAGILVLIIGIIYLLLQVIDFLSSKSNAYAVKDGAVQISTSELLNHSRTILTILFAITGGILLLKGKRTGWIIGVSILLLLTTILVGIMVASFPIVGIAQKMIGITFIVVLLLALLFLLLPSARMKYKVGKRTYLPTLVIYIALAAMYFFLQ
jgi:hypothetical protein